MKQPKNALKPFSPWLTGRPVAQQLTVATVQLLSNDITRLVDTDLTNMALNARNEDQRFGFIPSAKRTPKILFITLSHIS